MIIAIEPIRDLEPFRPCKVNEFVDHSAQSTMVVRWQLDLGVIELDMCGECVGEALENQQGGVGIAFLTSPPDGRRESDED